MTNTAQIVLLIEVGVIAVAALAYLLRALR